VFVAIVIVALVVLTFGLVVYAVPSQTARIVIASVGVGVASYVGWIIAVADQDHTTVWIVLTSVGCYGSALVLVWLVIRALR
jgi:hypothetical protein